MEINPLRKRYITENYIGTLSLGNFYFRRDDGKQVHDREVTVNVNAFSDQVSTHDYNHGKPPYKTMGSFFSARYSKPLGLADQRVTILGPTVSHSAVPGGKIGEIWRRVYVGGFQGPVDRVSTSGWQGAFDALNPTPNGSTLNPDDGTAGGADAYARMAPKVGRAGLGQALAEVRDVPHMLKTSAVGILNLKYTGVRLKNAYKLMGGDMESKAMAFKSLHKGGKEAANHFINHQFGWSPFLKDVEDGFNTAFNAQRYISSVSERNNQWLKRSYTAPETLDEQVIWSESFNNLPCNPILTGSNANNDWLRSNLIGKYTITRQVIVERWYTGLFKYYRPEFDKGLQNEFSSLQTARQYMTLLGLNISPSLIYKVTPWTWLVDWLSGLGRNVERFEEALSDSVLSKNTCAMRHITVRWKYHVKTWTQDGQALDLVWYRSQETKRRSIGLSPYGFTLPWSGLSLRQLAILASLGISRT